MRRLYYSPSGVHIIRRCHRAAGYRYIDEVREPEVPWRDIQRGKPHTPQQYAAAFGKEGHRVGELCFGASADTPIIDWASEPAQLYAVGLRHLPSRHQSPMALVEWPVGETPTGLMREEGVPLMWRHEGVNWAGYRDLIIEPTLREARRVGFAPRRATLVDYKFTSDLRYAQTSDTLRTDCAACVYALEWMHRTGEAWVPCVWLYFQRKGPPKCMPVRFVVYRSQAEEVVGRAAEDVKAFDAVDRTSDAAYNSRACWDYAGPAGGGCCYHVENGGQCDVRRSVGAFAEKFVQLKKKR